MRTTRKTQKPAILAVATAVTLLTATGVLPRWPGLVHLVALPPLDLFADLRLLEARASSYLVFGVGLAISLGLRSSVLALTLGGLNRKRLGLALRFYVVALIPAVVAGGFQFSALATLYHWYFCSF